MLRAQRRFGPPILIALGVLILMATLGYWRYAEALAHPAPAALPPSLAELPLVSASYSGEAIAEIARLHGKSFALTSGAVGLYGGRGQATLWVSGTPIHLIATEMLQAMRDRLAKGNSPFTLVAERQEGGRILYELDGLGQKHFTFQSGTLVIWLAADPQIAEQALKETLAFYP